MNTILTGQLDSLFDRHPTTIARDLKLNFKKMLENGALDEKESSLVALATATAVGLSPLATAARARLQALDFSPEQIDEAAESAAIMAMLNTYYRFRHLLNEKNPDVTELYKNAGLRMTALAKPQLGKERFEMLALAVSVLSGCQTCIVAHEKVLRDSGIPTEKIHDLARLAAIVKGIQTLNDIPKE